MDTTLLVGIAGATLILIAFTLNQFHIWNQDEKRYDATNAVGSLLLVFYAFLLSSWPFLVLNFVWLLVSVRQLIRGK